MNKAVIMAGGFGTRLRPLTMKIPKPMVPVLNTPMMEHIVHLLKKYNIKNIVSLLYFHPDIITNYFGDGAGFGVNMEYIMAEADYGTAGAVKNGYEKLDDRFIIISGDVLTDFDLQKAIDFHVERGSKATILLTRVTKPLQYGIVMTEEDGKINRFLEKPSWGQVFSDTINTGIYILEPEVLDLIPYREEFDFSKDLFPTMLRKKMPLYGYVAEGYWKDVGNLDEYQKGQSDSLNDVIKLNKKGVENDGVFTGKGCKISPTAKLNGSVVIGNNVEIGDHAELTDCVIGDDSKIGAGAKLTRTTLWHECEVGDFAHLSDDVVCNGCKIGMSATIAENCFIAENCEIGDDAKLMPNLKLWPNKRVEIGATLNMSMVQEAKWLRELFTDARISGTSNVEINPEFGAKLGAALGMCFGKNAHFLASRDPDRVSRIMKRSISAGLTSVGVNVNDLQAVSIPQTRQEIRTGKYSGGFHIRRSPRVSNMSDIIIFNKEGRDISISTSKKIERYFFGEDIKRAAADDVGFIKYPERTNEIYINRYLELLNKDAISERGFTALVDYSYGHASTIFPYILGKLNVESISLHDYVDATRFKPSFGATVNDEQSQAVAIMKSLRYRLGVIMEPGAEKISLIDERGVVYHPMRLLTIVTKLFLETHKDLEPYKIGVSVAAGGEIDEIAADYNVEVTRIKNAHAAMMEATRDEDIKFVGGIWGNFIFPDFLFASDGMYSVGKILEMLAITQKEIHQLDEALPRKFQKTVEVECPWESRGAVMRMAMEHSDNFERELVEGVKIFFDGSSVLMLPDRERGVFQVIAESDRSDAAAKLADKYAAYVAQWRSGD